MREAVELLNVDRIDHGNTALDDPALVRELAVRATPLTVCPLSNVRLQVVPSLAVHPLRAMLDAGLCVTLNSDDPPFFHTTLGDEYEQAGLGDEALRRITRTAIEASFADYETKARLLKGGEA